MSLNYVGVGPSPIGDDDLIVDMVNAQNILDSLPVNRGSASTQISTRANGLASAASLATVLSGYVQASYVDTENGKNILKTQLGVAGGIASTDANNKVPLSQLPSMGDGFIFGPFGHNLPSLSGAAAGVSSITQPPVKFAEWAIQSNPLTFQPWVYMNVVTQATTLGRSVIEVRISSGPVSSYSTSNPLVAIGTGRRFFYGPQAIAVLPCASSVSQSGTSASPYGPGYNTYLTAWLYDAGNGISSVGSNSIISASAFLIKTSA